MRKVTQLFLMAITIAAFAACTGPKDLAINPGAIQGDWHLTSMNGDEFSEDDGYTFSFNTDGTVAGLAGCNYVVGEYSAEEDEDNEVGVVSLSSVAGTKIMCDSQSTDADYIAAVESVNNFEVREGNELVLTSDSNELVYSKVEEEEED